MIIFTHLTDVITHSDDEVIFNLSSAFYGKDILNVAQLIVKVGVLNGGNPVNEYVHTPQFDMDYYNLIMSDDELFYYFMNIVSASYNGKRVIVLVNRSIYRDAIMESIIKIIQQRYNYNCWIVEDIEDLDYVKEQIYASDGLYIINDLMRFNALCSSFGEGTMYQETLLEDRSQYEQSRNYQNGN